MFAYSYDDLDREQLETFIDFILSPLDGNSILSPSRKFKTTKDPNADEMLELLIHWLDSVVYALELIEGREQKANIFELEKKPVSVWKTQNTNFNFSELSKLRIILEDLRRYEPNSVIERCLVKESKGRPKDTQKITRLKDEVGRVYNYLRSNEVTSEDACSAINISLQQFKFPLMSNDSIRRRASNNKALPKYLFDKDDIELEDDNIESNLDLKSSKELQTMMSTVLLMQFVSDL